MTAAAERFLKRYLKRQKSATTITQARPGKPAPPAPSCPGRPALMAGMLGLLLTGFLHWPALAGTPGPAGLEPDLTGPPAGMVRLHVVAHSDHPRDQALKLLVRDALWRRYGAELLGLADEAGVLTWAAERREAVEALAQEVLASHGAGYGAHLVAGWAAFPETTLGGRPVPAGDYLAVRLILGEGAGQNWWCVLFPPLCLVDEAQLTGLQAQADDPAGPERVVPVWSPGTIGPPGDGEPAAPRPVGIDWRSSLLERSLGEAGSWPLRWSEAHQLLAGAARLVSPTAQARGDEGEPPPE